MHAPNLSPPLTQKAFLLLYGVLKLKVDIKIVFSPSFCTKIPIRFVDHLMDINHQNFTNPTWDPNITMEDYHFSHDHQLPFDHTIWTDYHLQNHCTPSSSSTPLQAPNLLSTQMVNLKKQEEEEEPEEELGALKEMMFKIAAMQPVDIDPATIRKPKRQNVRISNDPQSVAARHRREKISEKMRILQRLVPGGTKMDTASMLDEAIRYVKFLKRQIRLLQANHNPQSIGVATTTSTEDWLAVTMGKAPGSATTSGATIAGTSYTFGGNGRYGIPFCLSNRQF